LGSGDLSTEGGERPQIVVTVSLPVLQGLIGSASLALGGPINAEVARRIACDAELIPVVLGARGEPLDVGRASPEFHPPPWLGGSHAQLIAHDPELIRMRE
jgi:hypothetical protein